MSDTYSNSVAAGVLLDKSGPGPGTAPDPAARRAAERLTRGSLLARNTVWSLVGQITPLLFGLFAIPRLIHGLGTDRFGALTIAWMVVGYFSFFNLGLGRAMTNLVAQKLATDTDDELPPIIWTTNLLMAGLGILGTIVLMPLSPLVVSHLHTPPALQREVTRAFYVLAVAVPFVISTAGFRGVLEARQQFKIINVVRIPMGIATFFAPLLVLVWSNNLVPVVAALVFARILAWLAYVWLALRDLPSLRRRIVIDLSTLPALFSLGAWMTISNMVSPMMQYLDRFLVGVLLSLTAVAYYATPFDVVTKLLIVPGAVIGVLFPAFSTALVADRERAAKLFRRAVKYVALMLFPPALLLVLFARDGLTLWLGAAFADHGTVVAQLLAIGVFANGVAFIPFALVQGAGRPDITGKLHLIEMPIYLALVWVLTKNLGIEGTAMAWAARVILDCGLLFWFANRFMEKRLRPGFLAAACIVAAVFAAAMLPLSLPVRIVVSVVVLAAYVGIAWFVLLAADEQAVLSRYFSRLTLRPAGGAK